MPQILAKLFSLGGNPISDRLYTNLASPNKHEKELRRLGGSGPTQQVTTAATQQDKTAKK
jgi:hypothetical protein